MHSVCIHVYLRESLSHCIDRDMESANAAPEWINVQYPGGDDSAYPLIMKRSEEATHQNLKDGLRNYMTAVASKQNLYSNQQILIPVNQDIMDGRHFHGTSTA